MREVQIRVECDACRDEIHETAEGRNIVGLKVRDQVMEIDLCDDCISGTFLQEARPVQVKRKSAKPGTVGPHACDMCDKRFTKPAGLSRHRNQTHGVKS